MKPIPRDHNLTRVAKRFRKNMTKSEVILWQCLRLRQIRGAKFRRQHVLLRYIVDFYCPRVRLAIEVDGLSHETDRAAEYDDKRQQALERHGVTVLRFTSADVYDDLENVLLGIAGTLDDLGHSNASSKT